MSVYDSDGDGLYDCGASDYIPDQQSAAQAEPPAAGSANPPEPATVPMMAQVLPPDNSSTSKLPHALAIFGVCVVALIWANSLDGGK